MPQSHFPFIDKYLELSQGTADLQDMYPETFQPIDQALISSSDRHLISPVGGNSYLSPGSFSGLIGDPIMPQGIMPVNCQDYDAVPDSQYVADQCPEILNLDENKSEITMTSLDDSAPIHTDPQEWSQNDVRHWVTYQLDRYNISYDSICWNDMTGIQFCLLSRDQLSFQLQNKHVASILYNEFQKWKNEYQIIGMHPSNLEYSNYHNLNESYKTGHFSMLHDYMTMVSMPPKCVSPSSKSNDSISSNSDSSDQGIPTSQRSFNQENSFESQQPREIRQIKKHKQNIHLWQFLKELLMQEDKYKKYIKWLDAKQGVFKIEDSGRVAKLWGERKNRPAMNYDKLSRSIRQYYNKGIIKKTEKNKRLVYKFCSGYL